MGYSPRVPMPDFGSYYIYGPVGSGKTVLAAQMFIEAKRRQYFERLPGQYLFVNSYDFFEDLKKSFDDPHMDGHAILAQFSNAEYLVLDDLGSVRFTEWSLSQLQILINNRYEMLLTTVITSNLDLGELANATGDDRIPSRIKRMCKTIRIK